MREVVSSNHRREGKSSAYTVGSSLRFKSQNADSNPREKTSGCGTQITEIRRRHNWYRQDFRPGNNGVGATKELTLCKLS